MLKFFLINIIIRKTYYLTMQKSVLFLLLFALKAHSLFAFQTGNLSSILSSSANDADKIKQINVLASRLIENNQLNDAETATQKALEMAKSTSFDFGRAGALDNMGLIAQSRFDYTNAMNYFVEALRIKDGTGDKLGIASSKNLIGKVFFLQRNEDNALVNYQAALTLLTNTANNLPILAETHRNLGDVYLTQKLYGKATAEFDIALKIWAEDLQDFKKAASIANYLGKTVADIGDNDGALTYFNASLNFHRNLEDVNGIANDYLQISKIYNALNDNDLALENVGNALAAFQQTNNEFGIASAFNIAGKIALKANDRSKAEENFEKSAEILRGMTVQPGVPEIFKSLAEGFGEMGNFPKAFAYSQAYSSSKDSLFNKEKAASLLELTTKYESQFAVKEKNRQLSVFEKEKAAEQKVRWLLMGLMGFALLTIYFVLKSYRQKKKDNEKLTSMNETIHEQHAEIARKNIEMNLANHELQDKNGRLDYLNSQLVTEISERENSQRSLFNKDHYLALITSKMRQPLNDIVGLAQSLINEKPRADQKDHIQNLQFSANNLLVLINDVLDFSEIEASKISLETIDFRPDDVIQELKKEIKSTPDVRYEFSIDARIPEEVNGDPAKLNQILTYLLKNIKQDMSNGVVKANLMRSELIDNELTLKIDIQAIGDNVNFKILDTAFNKPTNRDDFDGMGEIEIEYMITRRLVELQNGSIQAFQTKEETVVTVFLPFKVVEDAENAENTEGSAPLYYNNYLEGKRILVVEDNKVNQMLVVSMLKKKGVHMVAANDGIEGLEALQKGNFDLILMDIQMPRMDGYHAVAEIRRMKNPIKSTLPIIALTASAYVTEKEKAQLFGMTDHIGKPFSPEEMIEKITRVLMSHKASTDDSVMPQASSKE